MFKQSFKIGIGLLIEEDAFNVMRQSQLRLTRATNNSIGLQQPPHITVRSPLTLNNLADIDHMITITNELAAQYTSVNIVLDSVRTFTDKVIYFSVAEINELMHLHKKINSMLQIDTHEPPIFHATLAHELSSDEFAVASNEIKNLQKALPLKTSLKKIGCFMEVNGQWIVIHAKVLGDIA